MRRLIFVVRHSGVIDISHLVESKHAIKAQMFVSLRWIIAVVAVGGKLLYRFVSGFLVIAIEDPPGAATRDILQAGINHSQPTAVTEARMKVPIPPQLWRDPTLFHPMLVTL